MSDETKFVYHYCAQWQEVPGTVGYFDGVATMTKPILTMADYIGLKNAINSRIGEKMTIVSLALLQNGI